jgi:NADPH:quinone reductase-like Zn-dependent oxidoreductase
MKAAVYERYGPPEVIQLKIVPQPIPKAHEVLIKIKATTVNRTDCGFRQPEYLIVRLISGFFKPRKKILGSEFSGEIEAIGDAVSKFKVGEQIFGLSTYKFGCHAEYICISENASIALKPNVTCHNEAAAVCDGLMLAINYIGKINFKTHPRILINGASGSIGSAAVQLAKYYGAQITAVCNTQNLELLKSLGVDEVIDYTKIDFTKTGKYYDVVLDAVGKSTYFQCKQILNPNGIYFSSELGPWSQNIFLALCTPFFSNKKVQFPIPKDNQDSIEFFRAIIEAGYYKALIDRVYDLEQIVAATQYVETGQKTGNVVIQI